MTVVPFRRPPEEDVPAEVQPGDYEPLITSPEDEAGMMLPLLPDWLSSAEEMRAALRQVTAVAWHHTAFHGIRFPQYALGTLWYAQVGARRLVVRLFRWANAAELWVLMSQAVAAGRAGHADAMRAHVEGEKVRGKRWATVGICAGLALVALLVAAAALPRLVWVAVGAAGLLVLAWHGKPRGRPLIQPAIIPPQYAPPTKSIVIRALESLQISAIGQAVREDTFGEQNFVTDVHRDGQGWGCDLDLPYGVTARMVLQRREQLASGLRRPLSAVWPEGVPHEHEGRLRVWIGYQDMAKVKPVPWPLLRAGQADVFASVPLGTDPRGRPVTGPLFEVNWLIGAAPGQGKTATVRGLNCAAALDPICDLWVHELAGKGDLEPLSRVAHRYCSGLDDESVGYAAQSMALLRAELQERSERFKRIPKEQRPDGKVTRELAGRKGLKLRPVVATFDEVQNLFMHPDHGKQAADDAAYVMRLGRAYGIILILATQRPTSESLPSAISGNVTVRYCLRVPGQVENDIILGTSAYKNGYKATVFRAKTDAGLAWLKGEADPQIVKGHYLDLVATARVCERARTLRQGLGVLSGYAAGDQGEAGAEPRDVLGDVLSVFHFGETGLHWQTIAARLADNYPGRWAGATADAVSAQCRALGLPSVQVKHEGVGAKGCRRDAVEITMGQP